MNVKFECVYEGAHTCIEPLGVGHCRCMHSLSSCLKYCGGIVGLSINHVHRMCLTPECLSKFSNSHVD